MTGFAARLLDDCCQLTAIKVEGVGSESVGPGWWVREGRRKTKRLPFQTVGAARNIFHDNYALSYAP